MIPALGLPFGLVTFAVVGFTYGFAFKRFVFFILLTRLLHAKTAVWVCNHLPRLSLRSGLWSGLGSGRCHTSNHFSHSIHFVSPREVSQNTTRFWAPAYNVIECEG